MKVFAFSPERDYSGGVVLVAAKSSDDAEKFLHKSFDEDFETWYGTFTCVQVQGLSYKGKEGVIRSDLYYE